VCLYRYRPHAPQRLVLGALYVHLHYRVAAGLSEDLVKAFTLDEILKEAGGDAIAKMDTEGAEYEALKSSNLRGVQAISIEAHGDPADLAKILKIHTEIRTYNTRSNLATAWLRARPRSYGLLAALYRLTASHTAAPTVTIVKGTRT
jgi:hypothetical protein